MLRDRRRRPQEVHPPTARRRRRARHAEADQRGRRRRRHRADARHRRAERPRDAAAARRARGRRAGRARRRAHRAATMALDREGDTSKSKAVELLRSAAAMQAKRGCRRPPRVPLAAQRREALLGEAGVFDGPLQRERDSQRDLLEAAETARLTTHNSRPSIETDAQIFTLVARAAAEIGVKDADGAAAAGAVAAAAAAASAGASSHQYLPGLPRSTSRENSSLTCRAHRHQAGVGGAYREVRGAVAAGGSVAIVVPVKRRPREGGSNEQVLRR